ncbi:hypothetical protein [Agrobacterium tumefaciens]
MPENEMQPYTVEQLQQKYAVSLHVGIPPAWTALRVFGDSVILRS